MHLIPRILDWVRCIIPRILDWVLCIIPRILDWVLCIREPSVEPPKPRENKSGVDLKDLYKESHGEMRALRDTEFKIVALYYQVCGFVLAANMVAISSNNVNDRIQIVVTVLSSVFLLLFWCLVHKRIAHDNVSYAFHMSRKRYIEAEWFGPDFPGRPTNVGPGASGPGYRKTQSLVALCAISVVTILIAVLVLKALPHGCP